MEGSGTRGLMIRIALVGVVMASGAAACGSKGGAAAQPSTSGPTHASPVPATGSPIPSATIPSPLDGTWQTGHLSEKDVVDAYVAAGGTAKDGRAFFEQLGYVPGKTYAVITLKFQAGTFSEFESGDGSPPQQGGSGSYELVGSNEVRITDDPRDSQCVATWRYVRQGDTLALQYVDDNNHCSHPLEVPGPIDPAGPTILASFPFTLAE
jgi:hypothetical protein